MPIVSIDNGASVAEWEVVTLTWAATEFLEFRHKEHAVLQDDVVNKNSFQWTSTHQHTYSTIGSVLSVNVSGSMCERKEGGRWKKQENVILPYKEREKFSRTAVKHKEWTKEDNLSYSPTSVIICLGTYKTSFLAFCVLHFCLLVRAKTVGRIWIYYRHNI